MESVGKKRKADENSSLEEFRKKRKIKENDLVIVCSFTRHGEFNHVLQEIFKNLDVQRLKRCRLVCKAWDEEACKALRKRCVVKLHSTESRTRPGRLRDFMKLLVARDPEFPMPFKTFHMQENLDDSQYRKHLKTVTEVIPDFELDFLGLRESRSSLLSTSCLNAHAAGLKHVTINSEDFRRKMLRSLSPGSHFPELESLNIQGDILVTTLRNLIRSAPKLKHITGNPFQSCIHGTVPALREMMSEPNFLKIKTFCLFNDDVELQDLEDLPCLKNLSSLTIADFQSKRPADEGVRLLGSLNRFRLCLTVLDVDVLTEVDDKTLKENFPFCPNLQHLQLQKMSQAYQIMRKCPSLRSIRFTILDLNLQSDCDDEGPCDTVETLDCSFDWQGTTLPTSMGLILRKLFPKWVNFRIDTPCFFEAGFPSQTNVSEWDIRWLTLSADVPFLPEALLKFLTGLKIDETPKVGIHSKTEGVTVQPTAQASKGLKSLALHSELLTNSIIEKCLSRMPLNLLQFCWNESLSVETVVQHLSHIPHIAVIGCCNPKFSRQMELLFSKLESVRCGCGLSQTDQDGYFCRSFGGPGTIIYKPHRADGLSHLSLL